MTTIWPPLLARHIRWADVDGLIVVLDAKAGRYLALPPETGELWRLMFMTDHGPPSIGPPDQSRRMERLGEQLKTIGWLKGADDPPVRPRRLALPCRSPLFCLISAFALLRFAGFQAALGWAERSAARPDEGSRVALQRCLARFTRAEAFIPHGRGMLDCLPRSLALFGYLRAHHLPANFIIGVKRFPFQAHAWVEVDGQPLLQSEPVARSEDAREGGQNFFTMLTIA
jgi:hypothetical protein|tara:strand:+ start:82326 stop:83009 length:684 start_codon:yes stop_codon:yes gene_type:complete